MRRGRTPSSRWSTTADACRICETSERKHTGRGLCDRCYRRAAARLRIFGSLPLSPIILIFSRPPLHGPRTPPLTTGEGWEIADASGLGTPHELSRRAVGFYLLGTPTVEWRREHDAEARVIAEFILLDHFGALSRNPASTERRWLFVDADAASAIPGLDLAEPSPALHLWMPVVDHPRDQVAALETYTKKSSGAETVAFLRELFDEAHD